MPTQTKKLFTVDDYYKMSETGILPEWPRTELINGEIIEVTSMGSRHAAVVGCATELFVTLFKGKALLRPQLPLRLNEFNEPEPDVALLKPRRDHYSTRHPGPADVFLVMEIADSSLKYDRDVKLPLYAQTGVLEVWIVNLALETLIVHRDPGDRTYKTHLKFGRSRSLSCVAFPEIPVNVDEILGPSDENTLSA